MEQGSKIAIIGFTHDMENFKLCEAVQGRRDNGASEQDCKYWRSKIRGSGQLWSFLNSCARTVVPHYNQCLDYGQELLGSYIGSGP